MSINREILSAFTDVESAAVSSHLKSLVSRMSGRKLEEDDWTSIYCRVKGIPEVGWSNLNLDVMHENLGLEQKMLKFSDDVSSVFGKTFMHPSATRAIRIPSTDMSPDRAMGIIFEQYAQFLDKRRDKVASVGAIEKRDVDLRTGWLLWTSSLQDFVYFEERTTAPDATDYIAEWNTRAGGTRLSSKNLWIFEKETGRKAFSVTTSAGPKIQPYFVVPVRESPMVYHWTAYGERINSNTVRISLAESVAERLVLKLGDDIGEAPTRQVLSDYVESRLKFIVNPNEMRTPPPASFKTLEIDSRVYSILRNRVGVNLDDSRLFEHLLDLLDAAATAMAAE